MTTYDELLTIPEPTDDELRAIESEDPIELWWGE